MPSPSPRRRRAAPTPAPAPSGGPRQAVLDAARVLFVREGLDGLTVRRIAERAGLTTMAVYTHWQGRDGLLGALYDEGVATLAAAQARALSALPPEATPVERVQALCRAFRETAHGVPHHYALMLGGTSHAFHPPAESAARALATLATLEEAVAAALVQALGTSDAARHAATIARQLFAFCHGWVALEQARMLGSQAYGETSSGIAPGAPPDAYTTAIAALLRVPAA